MSGPHVLDKVYEQFQTGISELRVSLFESSGILVTPKRGPSFQGYQVDHPLYHDRVADWINLADFFTSQQHLALLALDLGLSINICMLWLDDYKFHAHGLVYQDLVAFFLERYFMTRFPVNGRDILSIVHTLQVSMLFFSQLFPQILIVVIFVFAGWELLWWLWWLHWKFDFT